MGMNNKIILELTLHEAEVLRIAISGYLPTQENEMITLMLYHRIQSKIGDLAKNLKDESM